MINDIPKNFNIEFQCPKFNIVSYLKKDNGKIQKVYLMADDDYVLAIVYHKDFDKFFMISQYRYGIDHELVEFCGGGKKRGEDPFDAIQREIKEELGYSIGKNYNLQDIKLFSESYSNPSISRSKTFLFYIEVSGKNSKLNLDEFENIKYQLFTFNEINQFISCGLTTTSSALLWEQFKNFKSNLHIRNKIFKY